MGRSKLLALVALLIVGCSSAGPTGSAPPTVAPTPTVSPSPTPLPSPTIDPLLGQLQAAATATLAAGTVGFDSSLRYSGNLATKDGIALTGTGTMSFGARRELVSTIDYSALSLGNMRLILDDQRLYLGGTFLKALIPFDKWLLVDLASKDPRAVPFLGITKGQNDSSLVLYYLFGAVAPLEYVASEDVGAVTTKHYDFDLDLELAPDAAPAAVREHLLDAIAALRAAGISREIDGQVWIGPDGFVSRVSYTYTLGAVIGGGKMEVVYTFRDFGKPLVLAIPKAASIVRLEDLKR